MPLYPFTCRSCGHAFEKVVPSARTADVACPACESPEVGREFGLPAVAVRSTPPATNCRGDGPPCGAVGCGRTGRANPG